MTDGYNDKKQYPDAYVQSRKFRAVVADAVTEAHDRFGYVPNSPLYFYCLVGHIEFLFENFETIIDAMTDESTFEGIDFTAINPLLTTEEASNAKAIAIEGLSEITSDAKAENVHLLQVLYLALGSHYEKEYQKAILALEALSEEEQAELIENQILLAVCNIRWAEVIDYTRTFTSVEKRFISQHIDELGSLIAETDQDISQMSDDFSQMSETSQAMACVMFVALVAATYVLSRILDETSPTGKSILETFDSKEKDAVASAWLTSLATSISSFVGSVPQAIRDEFGTLF